MGRRVAVSSMGTRLCLLYLLEGWVASRLALAAANETPGKHDAPAAYDIIARTNPLGLLGPRSKVKMNFEEGHFAKISCQDDEYIHITWAKWSAIFCVTNFDVTAEIRERCENTNMCEFIPFRDGGDKWYINLGEPCKFMPKRLTGDAECWKPCHHANCGEGECVSKVFNSYKCDCFPGNVNADGRETGLCFKNRCEPNPCGDGKCELTQGNFIYKCHCPTGQIFAFGTCKPYNMCAASPSPCPRGASCADGYGKIPKCTCPEFHVEKRESCVGIDTCKNMQCPPGAECIDGVGRQGKCVCSKYHNFVDGKCEPEDQCLINNGGCDPKASCEDGVGKRPKCRCPKHYELKKRKKCVFVNACGTDNGGCDENARCRHNEGEERTCTCEEGFIGDGEECYGPKSFFFPVNGVIRMILHDVEGKIVYDLGKCLKIVVDPKRNHYIVRSPGRKPQTNAKSRQRSETTEGGTYIITVHRQLFVIEVFIDVYPKGSTELGPMFEIRRSWEDSCAIEEVTVRDGRGPQTDVEFFMTTNIYVGRGIVADT